MAFDVPAEITTASYTPANTTDEQYLVFNSASTQTLDLENDATQTWAIGHVISGVNLGGGVLDINPDTGVNINGSTNTITITSGLGFTLINRDGADEWVCHIYNLVELAALAFLDTVGTTEIDDEAVTLAKLAHMATDSFLGRDTAATGDVEVLSAATARAILNVEDGADVTDATNVNAAGAVMESDYPAHSILATNSGISAPVPKTIEEQRVVGRITSGNITDLTAAELRTLINVEDGATAEVSATTAAEGIVELATSTETSTGTDTSRAITPDALSQSVFGEKSWSISIFDSSQDVATGDGTVGFCVPASMDGMDIVDCVASHHTAGTGTGTDTSAIQIRKRPAAGGGDVDVLTTKLTIDEDEVSSTTAATAFLVNTANDAIAEGDLIYVDVDTVTPTTAPKGLTVTITARIP